VKHVFFCATFKASQRAFVEGSAGSESPGRA
jgi:hypothetical protein